MDTPKGLNDHASRLWRLLAPTCKSVGRRAYLEEALRALTRADEAAAILAADGLVSTTESTKAKHLHPAAKAEKDARALFERMWSRLAFYWDSPDSLKADDATP